MLLSATIRSLPLALLLVGCGPGSGAGDGKASQRSAALPAPCLTCPDCGADGACPQSFCEPRSCVAGKCVLEPRDCSDGVSETWDRCDGREQRCHHYLGDAIKKCSADSQCVTGHGCQQFTCDQGLCRVTETSRNCSSVLLRPLLCEPRGERDLCEEAMRWQLSYPEKALVLLAGGPTCEGREGEHFFCNWGTEAAVPAELPPEAGSDGEVEELGATTRP